MVAYEQAQTIASDSGSGSSFVGDAPRQSQSINWELHSFLKLYGRPGTLALRWFQRALQQLLPLLAPLEAATCPSSQMLHPVAANVAAYRACMLSLLQQQLMFLDGCDLRTLQDHGD